MKRSGLKMPEIEGSKCEKCGKGTYRFNNYCGAYVCDGCGDHFGLARCFCGWTDGGEVITEQELEMW